MHLGESILVSLDVIVLFLCGCSEFIMNRTLHLVENSFIPSELHAREVETFSSPTCLNNETEKRKCVGGECNAQIQLQVHLEI